MEKFKDPKEYLREPYARILIPDENGTYSGEILEFPGCFSQGNSPNDALNNLEEAAVAWIRSCLDQGLEIPPPSINQGYGGRIALRLPRSIHRRAVELAQRDNTSLNQFLVAAIAARIGAEDFYNKLIGKFEERLASSNQSIIKLTSSSIHNSWHSTSEKHFNASQIKVYSTNRIFVADTSEVRTGGQRNG